MKKFKKMFLLAPLAAVLIFAGCMTPQVEIRMEYDKLTKAITASDDKRADYLLPAADDSVRDILGYIYDTAKQTKEMVERFSGMDKASIDAANPVFCQMFMQSVPKDDQNQSAVTDFPYYIKDVGISVMTMRFTVDSLSALEKTADAYFILSVTGTALKSKDGEVLKDSQNKDITYSTIVFFAPSPLITLNLHKYKVSDDSQEIPIYNVIYNYAKIDGKWKINGIKDGSSALYTP